MKAIFLIFGVAALVLGPCLPGRATEVLPPDFNSMVHRAEVIFRGKVTKIRSEWSGAGSERCIVSYVTFDVHKTLKGKAEATYVLKMLGGTVGDQAMEVDGVPKFKVGDETLLFVENNGTQFFPVVGVMHGYFRMETDAASGKSVVLQYDGQPLRATAEIDSEHERAMVPGGMAKKTAAATGAPMTISEFEAEIQKRAASKQ